MIKTPENRSSFPILGIDIDVSDYERAVNQILLWAQDRRSKRVFAANVHMVMEAWDNPQFKEVVNNADMVVSDGMPLVLALRALGFESARRVRGPDLMLLLCKEAEKEGLVTGFYGGSKHTQDKLLQFINNQYPSLKIFAPPAPPFRPLTKDENDEYIKLFNSNGVQLLFVGIGCPKQENWIHENHLYIKSVMIGVGAAFDQYSGKTKVAPLWMQKASLEWLYRLAHEPKRLWWRYLKHNPRFIIYFACQYVLHLFGYRAFGVKDKS